LHPRKGSEDCVYKKGKVVLVARVLTLAYTPDTEMNKEIESVIDRVGLRVTFSLLLSYVSCHLVVSFDKYNKACCELAR